MLRILTLADSKEIQEIKKRSKAELDKIAEQVKPIVEDVKKRGDKAVIEYTERFDKVKPEQIRVSSEEIKHAYKKVSKGVIDAIKVAAENVRRYHEKQMPKEWLTEIANGVKAGQLVRALDSVGCYVPGGNYPLVSTVVMTVVPAKVAGVKKIIVCSPPEIDPAIIVAADICGATAVYKAGGVQAVSAMAYGTETIPKVMKIVGPGNIYVTAAKKIVYGDCGIDFIAGPSEVMIVADERNNASYAAADMLAQAEHDKFASAILATTSRVFAVKVNKEIEKQLKLISTRKIAEESLRQYGAIVIVDDLDEAFELANAIAPEHLEIMIDDAKLLKKVNNAGAVFLGEYAAEAAGDYCSGPNHVLPTGGFAKVRAGLSVLDYVKMPTVQQLSRQGLSKLSSAITTLAEAEGLDAHKRAVELRIKSR